MATALEGKRVEVNTHPGAAIASYLTSLGLVLGGVLGGIYDFINQNAIFFGVVFGAITCYMNYKEKSMRIKSYADNGMRRRKTDFQND